MDQNSAKSKLLFSVTPCLRGEEVFKSMLIGVDRWR